MKESDVDAVMGVIRGYLTSESLEEFVLTAKTVGPGPVLTRGALVTMTIRVGAKGSYAMADVEKP